MPDGCELIQQVRQKAVDDRRAGVINANQFATVRRRCQQMEEICLRMSIVGHEWVIRPPGPGDAVAIGESVSKLEGYIANTEFASAAITALGEILEAVGDA